jgi:heme exporter protein D
MNWNSWHDFWMMGGYALYVWGSYAATLLLIIAEIVLLRMRRASALRVLRQNTDTQTS